MGRHPSRRSRAPSGRATKQFPPVQVGARDSRRSRGRVKPRSKTMTARRRGGGWGPRSAFRSLPSLEIVPEAVPSPERTGDCRSRRSRRKPDGDRPVFLGRRNGPGNTVALPVSRPHPRWPRAGPVAVRHRAHSYDRPPAAFVKARFPPRILPWNPLGVSLITFRTHIGGPGPAGEKLFSRRWPPSPTRPVAFRSGSVLTHRDAPAAPALPGPAGSVCPSARGAARTLGPRRPPPKLASTRRRFGAVNAQSVRTPLRPCAGSCRSLLNASRLGEGACCSASPALMENAPEPARPSAGWVLVSPAPSRRPTRNASSIRL